LEKNEWIGMQVEEPWLFASERLPLT